MNIWKIFFVFLRLGLTSFGGPVAHLAHFHHTFVRQSKWISERSFSESVALCQMLPGPTSSQVAMSMGMTWAGRAGAFAAWSGFTFPSALLLFLIARGLMSVPFASLPTILLGLKLSAVAIVLQALVSMVRSLCPDVPRALWAGLILFVSQKYHFLGSHFVWIVSGAAAGQLLLPSHSKNTPVEQLTPHAGPECPPPSKSDPFFLLLFAVLLLCLPLAVTHAESFHLQVFDKFFRAGAWVFGGGHVVLPLLVEEFTKNNLIPRETLLTAYGVAQAMPGPLFSISSFLGASLMPESAPTPSALWTAGLALIAIYLPSFLLLFGLRSYWRKFKDTPAFKGALLGVNATVVGLLAAVLFDPLITQTITGTIELVIVGGGFALLQFARWPSWAVVLWVVAMALFCLT